MHNQIAIYLLLLVVAHSASAQGERCSSNEAEISRQIASLTTSYQNRIKQLERQEAFDVLQYAPTYWAGQQEIRRKYAGMIQDLELERDRDLSNLRARIVKVCEAPPAVQQPITPSAQSSGAELVEVLSKLTELHASGVLSDEEFQQAKRRALGLD